jgi:acyl-CoA thioesterase
MCGRCLLAKGSRVHFATKVVQGGLLEEDGEIWDESGTLVALSRQMAVAPRVV